MWNLRTPSGGSCDHTELLGVWSLIWPSHFLPLRLVLYYFSFLFQCFLNFSQLYLWLSLHFNFKRNFSESRKIKRNWNMWFLKMWFLNMLVILCLIAQSCPTLWTPWTVACQGPLYNSDITCDIKSIFL